MAAEPAATQFSDLLHSYSSRHLLLRQSVVGCQDVTNGRRDCQDSLLLRQTDEPPLPSVPSLASLASVACPLPPPPATRQRLKYSTTTSLPNDTRTRPQLHADYTQLRPKRAEAAVSEATPASGSSQHGMRPRHRTRQWRSYAKLRFALRTASRNAPSATLHPDRIRWSGCYGPMRISATFRNGVPTCATINKTPSSNPTYSQRRG